LRRLLAEGRIQIGKRTSNEPIDVARAVTQLGSSRGIVAFQRYGYIERNGQSNLAVPLSRFQVPKNSSPRIACLDDLDRWLPQLRRQARAKEAPARLQLVERRLSDTLFAVTLHPNEPVRWQATLLALTDVEAIMRTGSGFKAGPVPSLRPEWVEAADDGSTEFRLAVACALQSRFDPIRRHWLPVDKWQKRFATTGSSTQIRLESRPEVVMGGRNGIEDAVAIVQRRIIEARQHENNALRLFPAKRASAHPADLSRLLAGEVNLDWTMRLASALAALNRRQWENAPCLPKAIVDHAYPDDAWLAIRLALLPFPLPPEDKRIPVDPAIVRRLESGDAVSAVKLALQRLRAAGIVTTIRVATVPPQTALLWAAALVFPISKYTAAGFIRRLDPNSLKEKI
jgi:CRISPR-associated protein Csx17